MARAARSLSGQRVYSSAEIGRLLGADASSVNRWIDAGRLRAHRTPGGHRRVLEADLLSFVDEQRLPAPAEPESRPAQSWVVLCDSDEQQLRALGRSLRASSEALQVLTCSSPLEALLRIGVYRPQLLLLDAQMPGLDWLQACRAIAGTVETRSTRVVASVARPSPELEARWRQAGALALLGKPVRAASLLEWLGAEHPSSLR